MPLDPNSKASLTIRWALVLPFSAIGAMCAFIISADNSIIGLYVMSGFAGAMFVVTGALIAPSHKTETTYVLGGVGATLSIAGAIWTLMQRDWAYTAPFILSLVGVAIAVYIKYSEPARIAKKKAEFIIAFRPDLGATFSPSAVPPSAALEAPRPDAEELSTKSKASGETVFHLFVQLPKNNSSPSLSSVLVTAEVWVKIEVDGSRKYGSRLYKCADPFAVIETKSVIYWKQCLDKLLVSAEHVIDWLQSLEEAGSSKYLHLKDGKREVVDEMVLLAGLTSASLHYAISNMDQLEYPESLKKWIRAGIASGDMFSRSVDTQKASLLAAVLSEHTIDPIFIAHLEKSVGGG